MIIKSFEINKIDPFKNNLILFYGQNEGLKDENILKLSSKFHNIIKYLNLKLKIRVLIYSAI